MHRLSQISRLAVRGPAVPAGGSSSRLGALRFKTGVDSTAYDNDAAMKRQHEEAKSDAAKPEPNSEGVRIAEMRC